MDWCWGVDEDTRCCVILRLATALSPKQPNQKPPLSAMTGSGGFLLYGKDVGDVQRVIISLRDLNNS